MTGLAYCGSS